MLLTTGEQAIPHSIVVLPGAPGSIAVGVHGFNYGGMGVFILDDGQPRANFIQPPEVFTSFIANGPPGYLLGVGQSDNLLVFRLSTFGATYESHGGLIGSYQTGFEYSAGNVYGSTGEVIDLTNPDDPVPVGKFAFGNCSVAVRSANRIMMLCTNQGGGAILRILDTNTFTSVGSVTLPEDLVYLAEFKYLGGDAVALLPYDMPLRIMHAPIIGTPP
jgi:hypothetical protein